MLRNPYIQNDGKLKSRLSSEDFQVLKQEICAEKALSEHELIALWKILKHMQADLELPENTSILDLLSLFQEFEEIRKTFGLETNNFNQLNEILIDLTTARDMLEISTDKSVSEVISSLVPLDITTLGLVENSLLEKLLLLYRKNSGYH